ncbi:MAG: indolepyruvate oxidoreductase subunit beta family protein [Hyphomicrobiales bacterium]|nr:indolepyruvate oxidoreductase subunit beta family protein [Hyphomicrobiales bacterium]MCP4999300.1 indolepyruvate oxidoreductase subunit beta family protein [Hyphomicrobiales bacterium]
MAVEEQLAPRAPDPQLGGIIKLAVMAVGGQGGGVLTNWIESLARAEGYACQATSVAGVAQRTGATIYYIEMAPAGDAAPVFSLAPAAGDVDVLVAAEMMEAGRGIMRGFVTPDRTTLIASTHRALAISEKTTPGDGVASSDEVRAAAEIAASRLILFNMERVALENGSVISASLFGALAGSDVLPFPRTAFEEAIRTGGRGVEASLRAFGAAFERAASEAIEPAETEMALVRHEAEPSGSGKLMASWQAMVFRMADWPETVREIAIPGLHKVVDFQDIAYGAEYLNRVSDVLARDTADKDHRLTREAAKYIANAMAYDDVIRVADLKTRSKRFARIRSEMGAPEDSLVQLTEFMHPRAEEIAGMLPAGIGRKVEASRRWMARFDHWFNKGRRLRTDRTWSFVMLYGVGGLRGYRRRTLRHAVEKEHLDRWLETVLSYLSSDYDLAVEVVRCRRLVKGYSNTHARGLSKFDRVVDAAKLLAGRDDAAEWLERLREAALQDEKGEALDGAIKTVQSFVGD